MNRDITKKDIEEDYKIAAEIVALYGDGYLPVFERVHREMEKIIEADGIKSLALKIAYVSINNNKKE